MMTQDEKHALRRYEERLQAHREAFGGLPALRMIEATAGDADMLHLFLMHFTAFGIEMTRPVEGWITRAGQACRGSGYQEIGDALVVHAAHEADHHHFMVADIEALTDRWNGRHAGQIDATALLSMPAPDSTARYAALHEAVIAGDAPFAQIAIEYEIEALSTHYGAKLLSAAGASFGEDGEGFSFLRSHIALDAGHTEFNRRQIARFLARHPDRLDDMATAGATALGIYGDFIDDCLQAALRLTTETADTALGCTLHSPPGPLAPWSVPEWLAWLRALRTRVLHDGGTRPAFAPGGGLFGDADAADAVSYHLALSDEGLPTGTIRLLPLAEGRGITVVDRAFGCATIDAALAGIGTTDTRCIEVSRLVLHPSYRTATALRRLLAGAWTFAAATGASGLIAAVGTRDHQDRLLAMFGAKPFPGLAPRPVPAYDDAVRLMWWDVDPGTPPGYAEVATMQAFMARTLPRLSMQQPRRRAA